MLFAARRNRSLRLQKKTRTHGTVDSDDGRLLRFDVVDHEAGENRRAFRRDREGEVVVAACGTHHRLRARRRVCDFAHAGTCGASERPACLRTHGL